MENQLGRLPAVTVLMSVHNEERFVRSAIDSILGQTEANFEFIIIDDASTDGTRLILESYTDPRIILLRNNQNLGLTKSLIIGLNKARSRYVARMDADDISLTDRLEKQSDFLNHHPEVVGVGGGSILINETDEEIGQKNPPVDPELIAFHLMLKNQITHSTIMFRKAEITGLGGYNENFPYVQDYELWSRLILAGHKLTNLSEPVIKYRFHQTSITQGKNRDQAHNLAMTISTKNIQNYHSANREDCLALLNAIHRQKVSSWREALKSQRLLKDFTKNYLAKEQPSKSNRQAILAYTDFIHRQIWRWYIKNMIGIIHPQ